MAQQKVIVGFKQLLNMAHQKGLVGIETEAINIQEGYAFFTAKVTLLQDGERRVFTGHADATKANVAPAMQSCLPRMAETRSIVRALRLAVNVGEVAAEELPEYEERPRFERVKAEPATGDLCPSCHAPVGKPHLKTCKIATVPTA